MAKTTVPPPTLLEQTGLTKHARRRMEVEWRTAVRETIKAQAEGRCVMAGRVIAFPGVTIAPAPNPRVMESDDEFSPDVVCAACRQLTGLGKEGT